MASTSGQRRVATIAATLSSDYQSLILDIRRSLGMIKSVAVDLEKEEQSSDMVKQLEDVVLELLQKSADCTHYSTATQAVADNYKPPEEEEEPTDFESLLLGEFHNIKAESSNVPHSDPLYRQFKEAIWNVHHEGEPMPGEEHEEIVMTSTQSNLLNMTCPLTGKPLTELENPVRSMDCKHIYEKSPIMQYIDTKKPHANCPAAGCPKILKASRVLCDPMLPIEIAEIRSRGDQTKTQLVEDCMELDDDHDN